MREFLRRVVKDGVPLAILLGALLFSASYAIVNRYEITGAGSSGHVLRLDRWTGRINHCVDGFDYENPAPAGLNCELAGPPTQ